MSVLSPAPGWPLQHIGDSVTVDDLTAREVDVLTMVTQGFSNHEIAESLYLSINSVKTYIRGAYRKIGATRRSHAVIWGFQRGLLDHTVDPYRPTAPVAPAVPAA